MGEIHKIGREYYIEFFARGLKYQQKAGPDRVYAQKLLQEIEQKIAHGEMGIIVRDADIDIFVKDFLEYISQLYSPESCERFKRALEHFHEYVKDEFSDATKLSQLTPKVFEQYKNFLLREAKYEDKPIPPRIINWTLILLREFCEYGRKVGFLNDNPLLHIKFVPASYRTPVFLNEQELSALLSRLPHDRAWLFEILVFTGVTVEELWSLKWDNIEATHHQLIVGKGKKERTVPLNPHIYSVLKKKQHKGEYIAGELRAAFGDMKRFKEYFQKAMAQLQTDKPITFYTLRHTFAFLALKKNFSLVALAKLFGFKDILRAEAYFPYLLLKKDDAFSPSPYNV